MDIAIHWLESGIKMITLRGRMDIEGTNQIDIRLSAETSTERASVVVDLSEVDFMASVGIGVLVRSYKTLKLRGGKMVLLNPRKVVELVLDRTLVNTLIPICYDLKTACEQVIQ
ncbi:MAG TPA: STAS domain-containing protein [Bacteroidota bacterium]|nr:STAS domain-containing protein [Bacteroidota bacterium]